MSYGLEGTWFNGLSEAGAYGDDAQAATNYPLVQITNNGTRTCLVRAHRNHSSMGVGTGSATVTMHLKVPAGIELGASQLQVVAKGIASNPVSLTIN